MMKNGHDHETLSLFADLEAFLARFIAYPSKHAHVAHALWIAHTHLMEAWESTPRIAFLSPEPASGKSRAVEVTELLVPRSVNAIGVSSAYLFRKIGDPAGRPTILFDEIDTIFGPRAKEHEDIRALLNAGHRRGAVTGRCVVKGKRILTEETPAYCAVALAGLGDLPDTILSRSVIVRMRRRAPDETIEPFRHRQHAPDGEDIRDLLAAWAKPRGDLAAEAEPAFPDTIADRNADVWEPLFTIADFVGGDWPNRARAAAVALVALDSESTQTRGVKLLADIKAIFGEESALSTDRLLSSLNTLDESPWGEIPLTDRKLAHRLRGFGVRPKRLRVGVDVVRGYDREAFIDAWKRYLPVGVFPERSATTATTDTAAPSDPFPLSN